MRYTKMFALAMTLCMITSACGSNDALKRHSLAAETLEDLATESRAIVKEVREDRLREAGLAARDAGDDIELAVRAAAAEFDSGPLIPAVNLFIAAKTVYVRAVLVAAQSDSPSYSDLKPILRAAVDAYTSLRRAVGDAAKLPEIPVVVVDLLSWSGDPDDAAMLLSAPRELAFDMPGVSREPLRV